MADQPENSSLTLDRLKEFVETNHYDDEEINWDIPATRADPEDDSDDSSK